MACEKCNLLSLYAFFMSLQAKEFDLFKSVAVDVQGSLSEKIFLFIARIGIGLICGFL